MAEGDRFASNERQPFSVCSRHRIVQSPSNFPPPPQSSIFYPPNALLACCNCSIAHGMSARLVASNMP